MIADFFYTLFVGLGLVTSYEDWAQRRVRNRWIVMGLLLGAAGVAYLLWNSVLGHQGVRLGRSFEAVQSYERALQLPGLTPALRQNSQQRIASIRQN